MIASTENMPVETDAPEQGAEIPYDAGLQADLLEHGPEALKEWGKIVVRDVEREDRWNSTLWYAMGHDLTWEYTGGCLILTDPMNE